MQQALKPSNNRHEEKEEKNMQIELNKTITLIMLTTVFVPSHGNDSNNCNLQAPR